VRVLIAGSRGDEAQQPAQSLAAYPPQQSAQSLAAYQEPPRTAVFGCTLRAAHNNVGSTGAGLWDRSRSVEILCLTGSKDCDVARKFGSKLRSHPTPSYPHLLLLLPCLSARDHAMCLHGHGHGRRHHWRLVFVEQRTPTTSSALVPRQIRCFTSLILCPPFGDEPIPILDLERRVLVARKQWGNDCVAPNYFVYRREPSDQRPAEYGAQICVRAWGRADTATDKPMSI